MLREIKLLCSLNKFCLPQEMYHLGYIRRMSLKWTASVNSQMKSFISWRHCFFTAC